VAACHALHEALARGTHQKEALWESFMQHEWEPWDEWVDTTGADAPSILFLARSCIRPSIEYTARNLALKFPAPDVWLKGYCPYCGSLPSLLYIEGEGQRRGYCSWCSTRWGLHRLQCPQCDNRLHESLGYLVIEDEPQYRIHYCRLCKTYFKLIDIREALYPPFLPLEEWTTLHLDLVAQRAGWQQAPSPSPVVYGGRV
jgi:FdhE protein